MIPHLFSCTFGMKTDLFTRFQRLSYIQMLNSFIVVSPGFVDVIQNIGYFKFSKGRDTFHFRIEHLAIHHKPSFYPIANDTWQNPGVVAYHIRIDQWWNECSQPCTVLHMAVGANVSIYIFPLVIGVFVATQQEQP